MYISTNNFLDFRPEYSPPSATYDGNKELLNCYGRLANATEECAKRREAETVTHYSHTTSKSTRLVEHSFKGVVSKLQSEILHNTFLWLQIFQKIRHLLTLPGQKKTTLKYV